ncbi:hypothetical protein SALBM135S_04804 [Streptomyces alboniger]
MLPAPLPAVLLLCPSLLFPPLLFLPLPLIGCFSAVAGSWFTGSSWPGVLFAVLSSAAYAMIVAVGTISPRGGTVVPSAVTLVALFPSTARRRSTARGKRSRRPKSLVGASS